MSIVNIVDDLYQYDERSRKLFEEPCNEKLTLIFAGRKRLKENRILREKLFKRYLVPEYVWTEVVVRLQGYFGSEDTFSDDDSTLINHVTWFHFEIKYPFKDPKTGDNTYAWYKMGIVTTWTAPDQHAIIFFDAPDSIREQLKTACEAIKAGPALQNPYWAHEFLVGPIVQCYDKAVWNLRDQVKEFEISRRKGASVVPDDPAEDPEIETTKAAFNTLHEILRHSLHATETLGVAIETLASICARKRIFDEESAIREAIAEAATPEETSKTKTARVIARRWSKKITTYLDFKLSIVKSLEARAKANQARINSEITLAISSVAQRDSRVQAKIGRVQTRISKAQAEIGHAAQNDSNTMVKIAAVTMLFLPPSFVSAIFSTTFFEFTPPEGDKVSKDFWIFWAISIPLTIVVFAALYPGNKGLMFRSYFSKSGHHDPDEPSNFTSHDSIDLEKQTITAPKTEV
ncbi:hypothetical protein TWF481_006264 [Arthrobotrys musiformis]|uniref:Uncharacterized protein n=1 Tax=Arthrobotrys musiformis TaxID=47236 RepID=A0AAV9WI58_9PEZI